MKSWVIEKMHKIGTSLAKLTKRKRAKMQINKVGTEKGEAEQ